MLANGNSYCVLLWMLWRYKWHARSTTWMKTPSIGRPLSSLQQPMLTTNQCHRQQDNYFQHSLLTTDGKSLYPLPTVKSTFVSFDVLILLHSVIAFRRPIQIPILLFLTACVQPPTLVRDYSRLGWLPHGHSEEEHLEIAGVSFFTGQMPLLSPKQQYQNHEGIYKYSSFLDSHSRLKCKQSRCHVLLCKWVPGSSSQTQ